MGRLAAEPPAPSLDPTAKSQANLHSAEENADRYANNAAAPPVWTNTILSVAAKTPRRTRSINPAMPLPEYTGSSNIPSRRASSATASSMPAVGRP